MEEKRVRRVTIRHKGRKYPQIAIIFEDKSEKAITVHADLKIAEKLHLKIKKEIALGTFKISNYAPKRLQQGITLKEFSKNYLEHRSKLVQIEQLSMATYQHDKFALQLLLERLDNKINLKSLTNDDMINFVMLLKDSNNKKGALYKPGAINSYLKHLKTAFNWAVKEKLILESPFRDVGKLHNPNEGMYRLFFS